MSRVRSKAGAWVGWLVSALLIAGSIWLWTERQYVVDALQYNAYTPTADVRAVAKEAGLTNDGMFTFYATHPAIEASKEFNQHCERREADSPILGCYVANRIFIYDITDERLEGIKTVTAAHELLHAEYDRMSEADRRNLDALLQTEYRKAEANEDLAARMEYYAKTEPGESLNELHSIIGTEFASVDPALEKHYARFFTDRQNLVALHQRVDERFAGLRSEQAALEQQIKELADTINANTKNHNDEAVAVDRAVRDFNAKSDSFSSQAEFQAARSILITRINNLSAFRQAIQADVARYKVLYSKYESLNSEAASLNKSLDSTLAEPPMI